MKNQSFLITVALVLGMLSIFTDNCQAFIGTAGNTALVAGGGAKNNGNKNDGKSVKMADDDHDEYSNAATIADPIQPVNRCTFWVNHQLYRYILKPISKTYDAVLPSPVRRGVFNIFDNLEFPDRFVNDLLQWKLKRAGYESEKFVVNSVAGVGGIMKVSDHIPSLSELPRPDTAQTFAKWGIAHGCYVVLPVFGPKSVRDTVGFAGDIALSPLFWISLWFPSAAWLPAVSTPDSLRTFHDKFGAYDAATQNTMDRYLAIRSAYVQNRKKVEADAK